MIQGRQIVPYAPWQIPVEALDSPGVRERVRQIRERVRQIKEGDLDDSAWHRVSVDIVLSGIARPGHMAPLAGYRHEAIAFASAPVEPSTHSIRLKLGPHRYGRLAGSTRNRRRPSIRYVSKSA